MYGLVIGIGIFISILFAEKLVKDAGLNEKVLWKSAFWMILFGIIGARIYHVIDYWDVYAINPSKILALQEGGMGIFGGIIAGLLALIIYTSKLKEPVWKWLDIVGVVAPLGQSIGRWGNYFNNELMPYSIYESLLNLTLFLMLLKLKNKIKESSGIIFSIYLLGYGTIRLFLENIRINSWEINGINVAQGISILAITLSIVIMLKRSNET